MDRQIVLERIESLRRCVRRIEQRRPSSRERLEDDADLQDIVTVNLIRSVQLCVDLASHIIADTDVPAPATMGEAFDRLAEAGIIDSQLGLRLRKAVGFRNVAVHNYRSIDWGIVFAICTEDLDDFRAFADAVARAAGD